MGRYISDQNKVVILQESGTYAVPTATALWAGEVQSNAIDESENFLPDRFLGASNRNVSNFVQGPTDITGTLSVNAQNMFLMAHAIGSVYEVSGTSYSHIATEISTNVIQNPFTSGTGKETSVPFSFTLEDSKQAPGTGANFVRTIQGAVLNTTTLTASQGEKVKVEADYLAQNVAFSSGSTTAVTVAGGRPYLWSDCSLTLAGSTMDTAKEISLQINQNVGAPHYVNGSRAIGAPFPQNRDYTLNVTIDSAVERTQWLYHEYFKGGSTFNAVFDLNHDLTGSQHAIFTLSGAQITSMDNPSEVEGVNEATLEIMGGSLSFQDFTNPSNVGSYNPF